MISTTIVCTRDRGALLQEACKAFLTLGADPRCHELLIVDNGSQSGSLEVAQSQLRANPGKVRLIREPMPGLSRARNAGVQAAHGDLVLFLDDDATPHQNWLQGYLDAFSDSPVWSAGGPVEPVFSAGLPSWLDERFLPYLSAWDRGTEEHTLTYNEFPRGTNIAFRRQAFERYGPFSEKLGRRGRSLRSCEETEMCLRLEREGHSIRYVPESKVQHFLNVGRLDVRWMERRFEAQGLSEAIMEYRHGGILALRSGWVRNRRACSTGANGVSVPGEPLGRCFRARWRGYGMGSVYAVAMVRRYRLRNTHDRTRRWLPFEGS